MIPLSHRQAVMGVSRRVHEIEQRLNSAPMLVEARLKCLLGDSDVTSQVGCGR